MKKKKKKKELERDLPITAKERGGVLKGRQKTTIIL